MASASIETESREADVSIGPDKKEKRPPYSPIEGSEGGEGCEGELSPDGFFLPVGRETHCLKVDIGIFRKQRLDFIKKRPTDLSIAKRLGGFYC